MFPTLRHGIAVNASDKRCTNFALQCFYQAYTCMYSYFRCIINIIMEFFEKSSDNWQKCWCDCYVYGIFLHDLQRSFVIVIFTIESIYIFNHSYKNWVFFHAIWIALLCHQREEENNFNSFTRAPMNLHITSTPNKNRTIIGQRGRINSNLLEIWRWREKERWDATILNYSPIFDLYTRREIKNAC